MTSFLFSCRRAEIPTITLDEVLEHSNIAAVAKGRWRSELELEIVLEEYLPTRAKVDMSTMPRVGEAVDVFKYTERQPGDAQESFVVFFRTSAPKPQVWLAANLVEDRLPSILGPSGSEVSMTDVRKKLMEEK